MHEPDRTFVPVGRLAPSPTGALHLGNAKTFLLAWLSIRSQQGHLIMRMEDLDHPKVKRHAVAQALEDLSWLGLDWDEGPDVGGTHEPYIQSQRIDQYKAALDVLMTLGCVYPCTCSRRDVQQAQSAPHEDGAEMRYTGHCRGRYASYEDAATAVSANRVPAWRFMTPPNLVSFVDGLQGLLCEVPYEVVGDFPLARHRDGAGYMLAVVVDDHQMGITEVVRGVDLSSATHRQNFIYAALDWQHPHYIHCPLVVGENGKRLAKRHGDTRLRSLRELGCSAQQVLGLLAWWSGLVDTLQPVSLSELLCRFSWEKVSRETSVLDDVVRQYLGM